MKTAKNQKSLPDVGSWGARFINPETAIETAGIKEGEKVADFGCGTGYFSFPAAKKVGADGMVWAIDVLKEKVEAIESQAKLSGVTNVIAKRANLENEKGSGLEAGSLDWVLLVNVLFQSSKKENFFSEAKRVLRQGGKALVVEWKILDLSIGPKKELRLGKEVAVRMAQKAGFEVVKEFDISNFHYGLILIK